MGYMGNGAHGPWGLWVMGPMGDLDFFACNFINTEWGTGGMEHMGNRPQWVWGTGGCTPLPM